MELSLFFEKFDRLVDAADAIPAIRELVLQLAVRGNLTNQIDRESSKAQLILSDEFKFRRSKREASDAEDIPFQIPANWSWVAVGDSMDMFNGRAFKPEEWSTEGTPIIRIQNLNNENAAFNRCKAEIDPKFHVQNDDFLISWSGTPGTSFGAFIWTRGFAYLNQHIFRCELVKGVFDKKFLRLAINARLDEMISHAQGAVGLRHITKGKLESIRLPLPPLAEQKRIVAKVDELMALCDRLDAQQQERETRHAALARASLARFAEAPTPANLDFLFHQSYAIPPADLRKSILTLAVQGKLVPQDPNDEPAMDVAKLSEESSSRVPFEIPELWNWIPLRQLAEINGGFAFKSTAYTEKGIRVVRISDFDEFGFKDHKVVRHPFSSDLRKFTLAENDIVMAMTGGTVGKSYFVKSLPEPMCVNQRVATIKVQDRATPRYVDIVIRSEITQEVIQTAKNSTNDNISMADIKGFAVPLPPLAEQRRIVAKVDQLMALVDQLEAQLTASRAAAARLLDALVAELTTTPARRATPPELLLAAEAPAAYSS